MLITIYKYYANEDNMQKKRIITAFALSFIVTCGCLAACAEEMFDSEIIIPEFSITGIALDFQVALISKNPADANKWFNMLDLLAYVDDVHFTKEQREKWSEVSESYKRAIHDLGMSERSNEVYRKNRKLEDLAVIEQTIKADKCTMNWSKLLGVHENNRPKRMSKVKQTRLQRLERIKAYIEQPVK